MDIISSTSAKPSPDPSPSPLESSSSSPLEPQVATPPSRSRPPHASSSPVAASSPAAKRADSSRPQMKQNPSSSSSQDQNAFEVPDPTDDNRATYLQVPGKIKLTPEELAEQKKVLDALAKQWREERLQKEYEASRKFGFVPFAEFLNGRTAMFFFVVGLLTEYWTGYTIPQQVELMLNTIGIYF